MLFDRVNKNEKRIMRKVEILIEGSETGGVYKGDAKKCDFTLQKLYE